MPQGKERNAEEMRADIFRKKFEFYRDRRQALFQNQLSSNTVLHELNFLVDQIYVPCIHERRMMSKLFSSLGSDER